jgi:tRNA(Ile)-lysidine synthetase-like protein
MKKIIYEINFILSQKTKINPKDNCICGLSGGQDSVLLFIILLHVKKQWNIKIQVLHFHHFWQQKNFFCAQQVWQLSCLFKNPIYIIISEVFLDTEKKARQWRHEGLERVSSLEKCNKILTGHTASDRIETAFWHLIRGTSPQGLISLKWQTTLLVQTQFFSFSQFFTLDTHILSVSQFLKRINNKKSEISKINSIYKRSKNKKKLGTLVFSPLAMESLMRQHLGNNAIALGNTFPFLSIKKNKNFEFLLTKKDFKQYGIVSVSIKELIKKLLNYEIKKQKSKQHFYKKNNKTFSFLIFNYCELLTFYGVKSYKIVFLEKKKHTTSSFLLFNLFFHKKNVLRPLLVIHRNDVTFFSKKYFLPVLCDPSNEKFCWSRNRIRHQLFPLLRFFFNPNTECIINNFLEISVEEQKYIESIIQKILKYWLKKHQNYNNIKNQLQLFPKAIQRRLLQKIFQSYKNLQPNLLQIEILRITIDKN